MSDKSEKRNPLHATDLVRRHRQAILDLAHQYGAENVRVFGSVVRGEATTESDLDLLVDMEPGRSLLDLIGFSQALEGRLGCRVDVVSSPGLSPHLRDRILRDARPL